MLGLWKEPELFVLPARTRKPFLKGAVLLLAACKQGLSGKKCGYQEAVLGSHFCGSRSTLKKKSFLRLYVDVHSGTLDIIL